MKDARDFYVTVALGTTWEVRAPVGQNLLLPVPGAADCCPTHFPTWPPTPRTPQNPPDPK
eukprot:6096412-Amphidinium_carterae.1